MALSFYLAGSPRRAGGDAAMTPWRASAWAVFLTVGIVVAAAPRRAAGTPPDLAGRPVGAVEFVCAAPIDRAGLLAILPFTVGSPWQPEWAEQTRAQILQTALFASVRVEPAARDADVVVTVFLERAPVVDAVEFRGNDTFSTARLQRAARIREGTVLRDGQAADAAVRLQRYYLERGFEAVRVTPVIQPAVPGDVDVTFQIDEGPATIVDRVEVTGELPVAADELLDESELEPGDRFERRLLRRSQEAIIHRLRDERYYEADVTTQWTPTAPQHGTLRFDIHPGPPFTVEFVGVRQFRERKLMGLLDLAKRAVVTDGTWRELGRRIRRAYQDDGFYFAAVDVRVEARLAQGGAHRGPRRRVAAGRGRRVQGERPSGQRHPAPRPGHRSTELAAVAQRGAARRRARRRYAPPVVPVPTLRVRDSRNRRSAHRHAARAGQDLCYGRRRRGPADGGAGGRGPCAGSGGRDRAGAADEGRGPAGSGAESRPIATRCWRRSASRDSWRRPWSRTSQNAPPARGGTRR